MIKTPLEATIKHNVLQNISIGFDYLYEKIFKTITAFKGINIFL
jgi:hypothetical protein